MRPNPSDAETVLGADLPSRRDEAWKWTDVRAALSDDVQGLTKPGLPKFTLPEGLTVSEQESTENVANTAMSRLTKSFAPKVWTINVPEDFSGETPLQIEGMESGHIRIRIHLAARAKLSIVEHHTGSNGFANIDTAIVMKSGSELDRVIIHDDSQTHTRTVTSHISQWENTVFTQHTLSFGGALSRLETRIAGMADTVQTHIHGAYLLNEKRHADMTSNVDLTAPHAFIRQSVKGVVTDKARGVFQGKFHVRRPAQHTDAEMRHDALMLSDSAEIRAKPELEIYADDVACAHGNTLGALDEQALFYMRQRGIPKAQARTLLTEAFVTDVFDTLKDEALRGSIKDKIKTWLEAQS